MAVYVPVLASSARTADTTSKTFNVSDKYETAHIVVDVTAGSGFNLVFTVQGYDQASGKSYTVLATPTINTAGTTVMKIGTDYTAAANIAKDILPFAWNVAVTQSGGISATYSVGASLV